MITPSNQTKIFTDNNTWFMIDYSVLGDELVDQISKPVDKCIDKTASCCKDSLSKTTSTIGCIDKSATLSKKINRGCSIGSVSVSRSLAIASDETLRFCARLEFAKNTNGTHQPIPTVHPTPDWRQDSDSDAEN